MQYIHTYSVDHPVAQATQAACSGNGSTSKTLARVAKREVSFDVDLSHVCSQAALRIGKRPPSQISQPISNRLVHTRFVQGFSDFQTCLGFFRLPYARHYNPRFVLFLPNFSFSLRFILQTIYVLKTNILHFLSLKSAVYIREQFLIKSGL